MTLSELLTRWFDVRPGEYRKVLLSFLGAYSILSFLILAQSLSKAFYIATFPVETQPYMTMMVALLTLPAVGLFGRAMGRGNPHRVYFAYVVGLALVLSGLFFGLPTPAGRVALPPEVATVAFYLITVLGASLLASGFWIVTSEQFSLRQAKRLFGLVGAGGTLGAMITGLAFKRLVETYSTVQLVPGLVILLAGLLVLQGLMPRLTTHHRHDEPRSGPAMREGIDLIKSDRHLRNIALVVFLATLISTVLDYQLLEVVSNRYDESGVAGFYAAFYGWAGVISLLVQVFVAGRLMSGAGIALSLAILPSFVLAGSTVMLLVPSGIYYFWVITATRGIDTSLRKSLHRSVLEYLFVPVAPTVRRKTKAFIDSVVDNVAGGAGAVILTVWVTWAGLPAWYLSLVVIGVSLAFIYATVKVGAQYTGTLRERLADDSGQLDTSGFDGRSLLTVTLTRLDVQAELEKAGISLDESGEEELTEDERRLEQRAREDGLTTLECISHPDVAVAARALDQRDDWDEAHVAALTRLLARSDLYGRAVDALLQVGRPAIGYLIDVLLDENADFVIRRRIPRVLAAVDTAEADQALIDALSAGRFEVRYRAAIALARRRKAHLAEAGGNWRSAVWQAIEREVSRDRPIWELQKILDGAEAGNDDFVSERVDVRGELSLEHTFRQLSLVLEPDAVKTAFHGIVMGDDNLKSLSLEYLEQVLPDAVRARLWPFIGDISEYQRRQSMRSVDEVVRELSQTGATLFGGDDARAALNEALRTHGRNKREKDEG